MALIDWSDALRLGVQRMDDTHREFVEKLNALAEAPDAEQLACLDDLIAHTEAHFGQETRWMVQLRFPPIECHEAEHADVLSVMREVRDGVAAGQTVLGRVLARELATWFRGHAGTMDMMLARYIQARRRRAQTAVAPVG
jgi:hemerythrin-like metal-binding protein